MAPKQIIGKIAVIKYRLANLRTIAGLLNSFVSIGDILVYFGAEKLTSKNGCYVLQVSIIAIVYQCSLLMF